MGSWFWNRAPEKLGYFSGQKGKITVQKKWNRLDLTCGSCLAFTTDIYCISDFYLEESSTDCYLYSIFYSSCSSLCGSHQQKKLPFKDGWKRLYPKVSFPVKTLFVEGFASKTGCIWGKPLWRGSFIYQEKIWEQQFCKWNFQLCVIASI